MECRNGPIFVLGTPFSGGSILSWALAQHANIAHVLETDWLADLATDLESVYERATATAHTSHLVAASIGAPRFYGAFGEAVDRLFGGENGRAGPPQRWVDCTPGHAFNVAGLIRLFPRARFIHVVRDAGSVVAALAGSTWPDGSVTTEDAAYEHWLKTSKAILEAELAFGSGTIMRVRYDDLRDHPEQTMRCCLGFVGEPFSAECLRPFRGLETVPGQAAERQDGRRATSGIRYEAALLSDMLVQGIAPRYQSNAGRAERLDEVFSERARPGGQRPAVGSLAQRIQEAVEHVVPAHSTVAVVSKGDDALLRLGDRKAGHFPQNAEGVFAGFHPANGKEVVTHLEELRERGYGYLVLPNPHFWWLDFYREFRDHLQSKHRTIFYQEDSCIIFNLNRPPGLSDTKLKLSFEPPQAAQAPRGG